MEKYSSYKDSGEKWLGEIPGHWEMARFRYNGTFTKGKLPKSTNGDEKGLPIIGASEMLGQPCRSYSEDGDAVYCQCGDILILWDGANAGIVSHNHKGIVSSTAVRYSCTNDRVDKDFLFYLTKAYERIFKQKVSGTTIPHMNMSYINECSLLIPPLPEQQAIVSYLDRVTGDIDRAIAESQRMIDLLNERKQIIIQHAVTKGLNPNAKRKNSGVEWIGDVPEGWECLPLKFVFEMRNGYTPSKNDPSLWSNGSIPWYRMEDIRKSGRFLNESIQKVTQKAVNGKGVFSAGSFIMAICTASIGEHAMLIVDSLANQQFANFKIRKSLSDKFLPMYLYYYFFVIGDFCRNNANSTCFQYVDMTALKNLPIAVPKMEEQRSIVSYLDENLQSLSQAIASAERKISLLRERKQIIINEVVTGKVKVR